MSPYWDPVLSSDTEDHRLYYNSKVFELLSPGVAGTGLKVDFDGGSDQGLEVDFTGFVKIPPPPSI